MSKKISELDAITILAADDILTLVRSSDLSNKRMTPANFFGSIPVDVSIDGVETSRGHVITLLDPPDAPTVAVDPVAGNLNGTYQYRMTFLTANGESELGTISGDVSPVNQKVLLSNLPTSTDPLVTDRRIYRTKAGVPGTYYYVANRNLSYTDYTDNIADGALGGNAHYLTGSMRPAGGITIGTDQVFRDYGLSLAIGRQAAYQFEVIGSGAFNNVFVGDYCATPFIAGASNTMVGALIGYGVAQNYVSENTYIGAKVAFSNPDGNYNTFLGAFAGRESTGDYGVFLGRNAGYYETGDHKLFIDNAQRASEADARVKALVYGVFAATPADQDFIMNGEVGINTIPEYTLDVSADSVSRFANFRLMTDRNAVEFFAIEGGPATVGSALYSREGSGGTYTKTWIDGEPLVFNANKSTGNVGVGISVPLAKLHIDQAVDDKAIPVLALDQADLSEGFINHIGTSAASAVGPISSWTTGNTIQGFVRVEINGAAYWMPYYDAPTS